MARTTPFGIAKFDEAQGKVFGYASIAVKADGELLEDLQGDLIEPDVLEQAAHQFALDFAEAGVMHVGKAVGRLIESVVIDDAKLEAMGLARKAEASPPTPTVGWWIGFQIDDRDIFKRVVDGTFSMFSIQGRGDRVNVG